MDWTGIVFMIHVIDFLLAVEAPNEEVHLQLETHSEVDGGSYEQE